MSTATLTLTPTLAAGHLSPKVRLTRRGRLLVLIMVLACLAGLFLLSAGRSEAGSQASVATTTRVVVQPGQTLWQVAAEAMPGTDTREAITHIRELNALTSSVVRPGQALVVPATA